METKKKYLVWIIIGIIVIIGIFIFLVNFKNSGESLSKSDGQIPIWMNIELADVGTGESFKISDFKGKPVLLESFAVWCPTCTKQQKEVKKLHEELGDSFISISLDTDPNEDKAKILAHIEENEFDWYYAISPIEMTQSLREDFGNRIINAPSAPVVLICENGDFRKLGGFGSRDADKLKEELEMGC